MIRYAAAVVVALCVCPAWAAAQDTEITINIASATVHKSPSTASPVIGHASRGTRLEITRDVGDWVKVVWPSATDGIGYVRVSTGSIGRRGASASQSASGAPVPRTTVDPAGSSGRARASSAQTGYRLPPRQTSTSHVFGLGARLGGPSFGIGVSARGWAHGRLGVQLDLSRSEVSNPIDLGTMSATLFSPSALYAFNDHVADYTWLRPYVGAGMTVYRSTLTIPAIGLAQSDTSTGFQMFGGGELTFASVPQFSVSAELGYYWFETPFVGYELKGLALGLAGHWYVK